MAGVASRERSHRLRPPLAAARRGLPGPRPDEGRVRHRPMDGRARRAGEVGSEGRGCAGERGQGREAAEGSGGLSAVAAFGIAIGLSTCLITKKTQALGSGNRGTSS